MLVPSTRSLAREALLAALLGLLAGGVYAATFQARQFGDSSLLYQQFATHREGAGFWYHALYIPCAGLLARSLPCLSPPEVLRLLSSAAGALGVSCAFVLARTHGASRTTASLGAGLLAFSPGYWFFSTTVEVHTLHAACVGVCALVTVFAPWRRPIAAAALVTCCLPLVVLSHQSGALLGPGFLALSQHARQRHGRPPFGWPTMLFVLGPLYLVGILAGVPLTAWMGGTTTSGLLHGTGDLLQGFATGFSLANAWEGWIQPLGLLLPLALVGALWRGLGPWSRATPILFFVPSATFFLLWGLPERGGYTLGSSLFLVLLASARPWGSARLLGAALVAQAAWGFLALRAFDSPVYRERQEVRRAAIVDAIGERGGVVSFNLQFQYIEAVLPDVVEVSLVDELTIGLGLGHSIEEFLDAVRKDVEPLLARTDRAILYDRSYVEVMSRVAPQALPYAEAAEAWLAERRRWVPIEGARWPLVRLEPLDQDRSR